MDIYGIEVGSKVTYKDIVSRFGIPDKFKTSDSEFGITEIYDIGGNFEAIRYNPEISTL